MQLITIDHVKAIIKQVGIKNFFQQLIQELQHDFSRWNEFQKMPRVANHFKNGVIELMPICDNDYYTFKYVNGHPYNPALNKLNVVALGVLADVGSGYPLMISEMTLLTAFRTAATAALAARYLAKKNSHKLCIIGTGAQAEFLALAHQAALEIQTIYYFDIDPEAMTKFANNLQPYHFNLMPCKDAHSAVREADIIVTATAAKKKTHVLEDAWIQSGVHIGGIGGDCPGKTELEPALLSRSKIVVEYREQTTIEGEIQNLSPDAIYAELWEIVSGKKPGRLSNDEITLFDSVGFALEDYSILKLINRLANKYHLGEEIKLVPRMNNPKNLFSLIDSNS